MTLFGKLDIKKLWKFEAHIGMGRSWWSYYTHYREATVLLAQSVNENTPVNTVSLPLLFLIRHSIELGLKANILIMEKFSTARPPLKLTSHELTFLYEVFSAHLAFLIKEYSVDSTSQSQINSYQSDLSNLVKQLVFLDKGSYNFRYPVDTTGNNVFSHADQVNVADLLILVEKIDAFLLFTTNVLEGNGMIDPNELE